MKYLILLCLAAPLFAQNPGNSPCSRVTNSATSGQVLSASATGKTPPCTWAAGGGATVPGAGMVKSNGTALQTATAGTDFNAAVFASAVTYGADPTGSADSTTAIQNAINANVGCIVLPKGTYKTSSPITLPSSACLIGQGYGANGNTTNLVTISNNASNVFTQDGSGNTGGVFISNLNFNTGSSGGHVFSATSGLWTQNIIQNVSATIAHASSGFFVCTTECDETTIENFYINPTAANSVGMIDIESTANAGNLIHKGIISAGGSSGAYQIILSHTSATTDGDDSIKDVICENCNAGFIKLLSKQSELLQNVNWADTVNPTGSAVYLGSSVSGSECLMIEIQSSTLIGTSSQPGYTAETGVALVLITDSYVSGVSGPTFDAIDSYVQLTHGTLSFNTSLKGQTQTICSGTLSLGTSAIASGAAATTVTHTCTGMLSSDNIMLDFNGSPLAVTGYIPNTSGMLTIIKWPTADTINVSVVNNTGSSITPGAITLNYRVTR